MTLSVVYFGQTRFSFYSVAGPRISNGFTRSTHQLTLGLHNCGDVRCRKRFSVKNMQHMKIHKYTQQFDRHWYMIQGKLEGYIRVQGVYEETINNSRINLKQTNKTKTPEGFMTLAHKLYKLFSQMFHLFTLGNVVCHFPQYCSGGGPVSRNLCVFFDVSLNKPLSRLSNGRWFWTSWRSCAITIVLCMHILALQHANLATPVPADSIVRNGARLSQTTGWDIFPQGTGDHERFVI